MAKITPIKGYLKIALAERDQTISLAYFQHSANHHWFEGCDPVSLIAPPPRSVYRLAPSGTMEALLSVHVFF